MAYEFVFGNNLWVLVEFAGAVLIYVILAGLTMLSLSPRRSQIDDELPVKWLFVIFIVGLSLFCIGYHNHHIEEIANPITWTACSDTCQAIHDYKIPYENALGLCEMSKAQYSCCYYDESGWGQCRYAKYVPDDPFKEYFEGTYGIGVDD